MSDQNDAATGAGDRGATVLGELIEATRAAVTAVLDEQKEHAADRVASVGEAVRRAGQTLDAAATPMMAETLAEAAGRIDAFSDVIRERSWGELAAEVADFARRRPTIFVAGAVALGFLGGRLLSGGPVRRGFAPPEPVASTPELAGLPPGSDGSVAAGFDAARSVTRGAT